VLLLAALEATLLRAGLTQVVRYHDLEGGEVVDFATPDTQQYLSVAVQPAEAGVRLMHIEFGSEDWPDLVTTAIDEAIRQVAYELVEPLLGEGSDARLRARRYLAGLLTEDELGA
jgi:hypothetical protein